MASFSVTSLGNHWHSSYCASFEEYNFCRLALYNFSQKKFSQITARALLMFVLCKMSDVTVSHACSAARYSLCNTVYLSLLFIH